MLAASRESEIAAAEQGLRGRALRNKWQTASGKIAIVAILVGLGATNFASAQPAKVGSEFTIASGVLENTGCAQPSVAGLKNDGFVAAYLCWDPEPPGASSTLEGGLFDNTGNRVRSILGIDARYDGLELPAVAGSVSGNFVVAWDQTAGASGNDIVVKRFGATGLRLAKQAIANSIRPGDQTQPSIAMLKDGGFVVVWRSHPVKGADAIYGRRFSAAGAPIGNDFRIGIRAPSNSGAPSVAALGAGGFVVVWDSGAQLYNARGKPSGGEFNFNSHRAASPSVPRVAALKNGGFVIVWLVGGKGIYGLRFNRLGRVAGKEFRIATASDANFPSVAGLSTGGFVAIWAQGADPGGIFGQTYDAQGMPAGSSFEVDTPDPFFVVEANNQPSVAALGSGGFVVTWPIDDTDGMVDIEAQLFGP